MFIFAGWLSPYPAWWSSNYRVLDTALAQDNRDNR